MATPIGHAIAGYILYRFAKPTEAGERVGLIVLCATIAIAPDLDVIPGIIVGRGK